jgi:AcrR family transcriptional regulator
VRDASNRNKRTKHQERTEQTRSALLLSARHIFARDGFQACRIEDIAADGGFTRGAFYAHFDTKEDLFFALMQQEVDKRSKRIRASIAKHNNLKDRLAVLREYYCKTIEDREWGLLRIEFKLFAVRHPKLRPALAAKHKQIRAFMQLDAISSLLGVSNKDQETQSIMLGGLREGLFLEHAFDPDWISKSQAEACLATVFEAFVAKVTSPLQQKNTQP